MKHLFDVRPRVSEPYPVLCGEGPVDALHSVWRPEWRQAVVVGDSNTAALFGKPLALRLRELGCEVLELEFPAGEPSKTRATKERLEDAMLAARIERGACIVAVGGGVVLDLAGFLAATYLRGIAHIHVATTLLAQVDAAIGGKTAVDTPFGKNLIGAFHHPRAVLLDQAALRSLPLVELRHGLAECVKHAVIRDELLFKSLERLTSFDDPPSAELILRSVAVKVAIVAVDPLEHGERRSLNFGHTVAHALEAATNHTTAHGAAVAIGMIIEARLAVTKGWLPKDALDRIVALLERIGLPVRAPCAFDAAAPFFAIDKKTSEGRIQCALPEQLGVFGAHDGQWTRSVTLAELLRAWT